MAVLQAKKLSKVYNGIYALKDLNLSIEKGEIFCLLGQNGAGKTTTINLFLGFINATSGVASIDDEEVKPNDTATKKNVAYIPEVVQLYGSLTGIENLAFFSRLAGFNYSDEELSSFLTRANLQIASHNLKLGNYSKGMRQKVGIAIAIAKEAKVILMDEPTSGLDPKATAEFTKICKELAADGKTIFMTTHDIFNAVNVGTKIGIMKEGTLIHTLSTSDINANELQKLYLETI
ncbi:ATP-binding cassette domain-containing protein [Flavobacterium psychroterrae]|uniref:ATP-binding cassette domain-containing protein n=1 Tax=Flavobacterium psychroterrae TaxID=2133767 RepID=A0ABS5PDR1_9FLAO|nr:ATP-binding cassette domain-containing protein [Flavobacterium psychroterrae]MBS7232421.1 ATP-binding cassette domain-containing protein [Flavobacterium psychroterrae]